MNLLNKVISMAEKKAPELLLTAAIGGVVATVVSTIIATKKAVPVIEEAKKEKAKEVSEEIGEEVQPEDLSIKDDFTTTVKAGWKYYIIPTLMAGITIASFVSSTNICKKRAVAATIATSIAQEALSAYEDKIQEMLPKGKAKELQEKVAEAISENHPKPEKDDPDSPPFKGPFLNSKDTIGVTYTGHGNELFQDGLTGQWFRSSQNFVDNNFIELQRIATKNDGVVDAEDYFDLNGIPRVDSLSDASWDLLSRDGTIGKLKYSYVAKKHKDTGEYYSIIFFSKYPRIQ